MWILLGIPSLCGRLFIYYIHANTCTHTLVVNTGISVSVAVAIAMAVAIAVAVAISIAVAGVTVARINDIERRLISGARCRHVALMEAAYIERIAEHAVQRVGHRARIIKAARPATRRYQWRINKRQIIIEDSLMQLLVHAQYSYWNFK